MDNETELRDLANKWREVSDLPSSDLKSKGEILETCANEVERILNDE